MNERFDLRVILQEIKVDEKVYRMKPVLLTQKEISEMREKMNRVKREEGRTA